MFSFDVTLLVQMFHFFIAWWLIDRYLFRFLVAEVQQEISFLEVLRAKNKKILDDIHAAKIEKERAWDTFKSVCKKHIPIPILELRVSKTDTVQEYGQEGKQEDFTAVSNIEVSTQDRARLVEQIADNLVRKVQHDI